MIKSDSQIYEGKPYLCFISSIFEINICSQNLPVKISENQEIYINEPGTILFVIYGQNKSNTKCWHCVKAEFQACAIDTFNHNLAMRKNFPIILKIWVFLELNSTAIHPFLCKTVAMFDTTENINEAVMIRYSGIIRILKTD